MARTIGNVDLIKLIEVCGQSGVYKLKHGSLEIEFGHVWPQRRAENEQPVAFQGNLSDNEEVSPEDERMVRELKAAELLIEDPVLYEEMQTGEGE